MSIDDVLQPEVKINLFGKEYAVNFTLRNFAAIKRVFGISEQELIQGMSESDIEKIVIAIWGTTLKFKPFDPQHPVEIEEQIDIERLYSLNFQQLTKLNNLLIEAFTKSMPDLPDKEDGKKKRKLRFRRWLGLEFLSLLIGKYFKNE